MGKIIGLLLTVCGVWLTVEVYMNGVDGAFGGALASLEGREPGAAAATPQSVPKRAGEAVEHAHAAAGARREQLLGE